jgi:DMSO/TMAO reductase YedYZ molybdopterin-dependent catalytic subunit
MPITPRLFGERGRNRAVSLGIDPDRLPPGQSPTIKWPVLTVGDTPQVSTDQWLLSVDGAVEEPYVLDWEAFTELAQTDWTGDIHCVTRWSKFGMTWRGADARALIERARPTAGATHLLAHSYGGYTTNLPLEDLLDGKAWIVYGYDGEPLSPAHGGPARLLVPHLYFWKSAKWVSSIQLRDDDEPGFWEGLGYHRYGDPWREQRYAGD